VDYLYQRWFLNCVVEGQADGEPITLLRKLREIETRLGSKKEFLKGPRLLDIDILLYGDQTIETPELKVPHPRMLERKFVLVPLAEIAPSISHPAWRGMTVRDALERTTDRSAVKQIQASTKAK
jgi:2-amino-4-hydroxy-6-hydroxymethyldihydropteridine diphosphokinase